MKNGVRRFFGLDDEEEYAEEQMAFSNEQGEAGDYGLPTSGSVHHENRESASLTPGTSQRPNVIPMGQRNTGARTSIHILEPRVYSEAEEIAELLLRNEAVLLNFRRMEQESASRILDFLQGAVYALRGDIQEVGEGIFLFVPANVEISGIDQDFY